MLDLDKYTDSKFKIIGFGVMDMFTRSEGHENEDFSCFRKVKLKITSLI